MDIREILEEMMEDDFWEGFDERELNEILDYVLDTDDMFDI